MLLPDHQPRAVTEPATSHQSPITSLKSTKHFSREVNRLLVRHDLQVCLRAALSSPDAETRERAVASALALYELRGALALPSGEC